MLVAILRLLIPLIVILIIARFVWPIIKRSGYSQQGKSNRIEVDAEVVKSEQHKTEYPKSETYTSPDTKEK